MELINQPNNYGCGFACIAMITGKEYQEVEDLYGQQILGEGVTYEILWYLLSHLGYASRIVLCANHEGDWPMELGYWDIWQVNIPNSGHYVVRAGNDIYDPMASDIQTVEEYNETYFPSAIIGVINA